MNRTILAMVAAIILSGCGNADSAKTTRTAAFGTDDEAAVRRLVDGFAKTWNQHDMNAMHELDTDDVEWINVVGHYWRGKATVHLGHAAVHKGMAAGANMSVESVNIRSIAPDVAVAVATMHFDGPGPGYEWLGGATKTRGSFTAVKHDGVWKIAHFQNTVIDPKAENDDAPKWGDRPGYPPRPGR